MAPEDRSAKVEGGMVLVRGSSGSKDAATAAARGRRRPLVTWLTLRSAFRTRKNTRKSPQCTLLVRHPLLGGFCYLSHLWISPVLHIVLLTSL